MRGGDGEQEEELDEGEGANIMTDADKKPSAENRGDLKDDEDSVVDDIAAGLSKRPKREFLKMKRQEENHLKNKAKRNGSKMAVDKNADKVESTIGKQTS